MVGIKSGLEQKAKDEVKELFSHAHARRNPTNSESCGDFNDKANTGMNPDTGRARRLRGRL